MLASSECRDYLFGEPSGYDTLLSSDEEDECSPAFFLAQAESQYGHEKRQDLYSEGTRRNVNKIKRDWEWYSTGTGHDPMEWLRYLSEPEHSNEACTALRGFFNWLCSRRRDSAGRSYRPVRCKSTLSTILRYWLMVVRAEVGRRLDPDTVEALNMAIAEVAREKNLDWHVRRKTVMYPEDFLEFARVFLTTTEMRFYCGWSRIQELLFCQLLAITGSRPGALARLRYGDLQVSLLARENEERPRILIRLSLIHTKQFLGPKPVNSYPIPDIPYDATLVISPHIFLLGMLFYRRAFKAASLDGPEKLYKLRVPKGLRELPLELRDGIENDFVFCEIDGSADGFCPDPSTALSTSALRYTLRRVGEITGFATHVSPYSFRYGAAKALNDSPLVSEQLQNTILQHQNSKVMERHYCVDVHVDLQGIWRGNGSHNTAVTRDACSLRRTIDPRRPFRLTVEDLRHLARQPTLQRLAKRKENLRKETRDLRHGPKDEYERSRQKYQEVIAKYRNEWQRERRKLLRTKRETFLRDQPVQDVEHQLQAGSSEAEVVGTVPNSPPLSPQHLALVEAVLRPPGETAEADVNRLIAAVNAVRGYCGVMEGTVAPPTKQRGVGKKRGDFGHG